MSIMTLKNTSFRTGQTLTIVGVAKPDAVQFAVNIGPNETDIALHVNPRFNRLGDINKVVCNSYQWGTWGAEVREGSFPFQRGMQFRIFIHLTPAHFVVTLPDGYNIHFPNRLRGEHYSFISVAGDAQITSFDIK